MTVTFRLCRARVIRISKRLNVSERDSEMIVPGDASDEWRPHRASAGDGGGDRVLQRRGNARLAARGYAQAKHGGLRLLSTDRTLVSFGATVIVPR